MKELKTTAMAVSKTKLLHLVAFIAIPSAETILVALTFYYFKKGKWKTIKV